MRIWKQAVMFYIGGGGYLILELLWRGWTHGSMFLVGGLCFLLLGQLDRMWWDMPLFMQGVVGAAVVTGVELCSGIVINRVFRLNVWDYSGYPFQFLGQICLPYFFLWIWVSLGGVVLCRVFRFALFGEPLARHRLF